MHNLDGLFSAFREPGIAVIDTEDRGSADQDRRFTPVALDKTNDLIRIYLREMGAVPLLTRDGEVALAKSIERGHLTVLKTLSRSPVIIQEIISLGDQLKKDPGIVTNVLHFRN